MSTSSVVADLVEDAREFLDGGAAELTALTELTELLEGVAAYGDRPVPTPSAELARLLGGRPAPVPGRAAPAHPRARRLVAGLAAAAVSGLSVTGAAAVANELPAPVQRAVAHFSEQFLPFRFPRPAGDRPAGRETAGTRPAPGRDTSPGSPGGALPGTAAGTSTRPGSPHPGTRPGAAAADHTRSGTGTQRGTPTRHVAAPPAGSDGAQARRTAPAAPVRSEPAPAHASHDPATGDAADGAPKDSPGTRKEPSSPATGGRGHLGTRDSGQAVRVTTSSAEDGAGRRNGVGAPVTEPKHADVSAAAAPARPGRSAGASGGQDAATQDGSAAPTP